MLKMKCPSCGKTIASPLLAELDTISCEQCHGIVPVTDVLIYAQGFTFHRSDLIKRLFRYKTLLSEVAREKELLEADQSASEVSKKSLGKVLTALEEVMAGARDHLRLEFSRPLPVLYQTPRQRYAGRLSNLSMSGARIESDSVTPVPQLKEALTVEFSLPGTLEQIKLPGKVAWLKKGHGQDAAALSIGIAFHAADEALLSVLWSFISDSASQQAD